MISLDNLQDLSGFLAYRKVEENSNMSPTYVKAEGHLTIPPIIMEVEVDENGPILKETSPGEKPILHFHDCGRKSKSF